MLTGFVSADVVFGALGSELFPTAYRSTASGFRLLCWIGGGVIGLVVVEARLFDLLGNHATAVTWMLAGAWIAPLIAVSVIQETARRELEEIAPVRSARD
jgi:hypothetical protein